ncbi:MULTISPECIES: Mrp/NBP35 family ATP-binding protein [Methanobacterium]|uniref:Iron-sulfur cluster carrier protein n=1 Tax=Methanobacterium bryantii TaxID=2161 RepID=A0A2A2H103_METBR|nr:MULTISPECIES: Mrp/NBP35 family ATP-binding protein [Methanobacterium]OEC87525.1 ATP-binding protein [Methanobacterium sp. A39]PAV03004.1 ATP-binding protein [Methanobacterium bryantii]
MALMQQDIEIIKRMHKIKHKIAVMSGKGGVGKSTIAVNLAAAFAKKGYKIGIMDADVHGPNVPKMFGVEGKSLKFDKNGIIPIETEEGIKVMSVGFFLSSQDTPVIWRGPAKTGVIRQFLAEVTWDDLDILIIDNPPGTGDEPLTILQTVPSLDGVVLVTTPQSVVQEDVEKSVNLVKNLNIPVIGIIENMSGFICPHCKNEILIFGKDGGAKIAKEMNIPFLERLPLNVETSVASDTGIPIVIKDPKSEISIKISEIMDKIESKLRAAPNS